MSTASSSSTAKEETTTTTPATMKSESSDKPPKSIAERIQARVDERNSWPTSHTHTVTELFGFLSKYGASLPKLPSQQELDQAFPVLPMDWEKLTTATAPLQVTWIGHATCLVQMGGFSILTDPIFSCRCAPVQFAGPARYRPPACTCDELLEKLDLDVIVVSHNHYDHLDYYSICDLSEKSRKPLTFVVPLGIASWMTSNISGITKRHTIVELDWHETYTVSNKNDNKLVVSEGGELAVTSVPMQHWSSRRGWDRDHTLWCGYSFRTKHQSSLFTGDTGWFEGVYDIGTQYGPFDLAMIPIGAYEPRDFMKVQHTNPSDAVKMMTALQATKAVPIHWGTFQLTKEPYLEPREKLEEAVKEAGMEPTSFDSWLIGETVVVHAAS